MCLKKRYLQSRNRPQQTDIDEETETADPSDEDEFDLSDISAKEKSREEIIAAAEAAAFSDK